jgi:hypothetical protein
MCRKTISGEILICIAWTHIFVFHVYCHRCKPRLFTADEKVKVEVDEIVLCSLHSKTISARIVYYECCDREVFFNDGPRCNSYREIIHCHCGDNIIVD